MSTSLANLADAPRGQRLQAVLVCACGSLDIAARGMCPRCLARRHHDQEYFGGHRETVLRRDKWTCQGCFYRPAQEDRDWIVVHHRVPGISQPALMISLCAACHAIVERLQALDVWLPPQLVILWREHPLDEAMGYEALLKMPGEKGVKVTVEALAAKVAKSVAYVYARCKLLALVPAGREGATELGFVTALMEKALGSPLEKYGVHVTDGGGHEATLDLLEALAGGGLRFGGFADNEGKHPTRWEKVAKHLDKLLFRWASGYLEENIIAALSDDRLETLLIDPADEKTGMRLRSLADRLGIQEKDFESVKTKAGSGLKTLILAAASGAVPEDKTLEKKQYQAHAQIWFKTVGGGRELAEKIFSLGAWSALRPQLMPFCNALRKAVDLPNIADIAP